MKCEETIKEVLSERASVDEKVERITKFMTWKRSEIKKAILEIGAGTNETNNKIIGRFWR